MSNDNGLFADGLSPGASLERTTHARPRSDRWWLNVSMILVDMLAISGSFAVAALLYEGIWLEPRAMTQGVLMLALYAACASLNDSWAFSSLLRWPVAIGRMVIALLMAAAILNLVAFFLKTNAEFSRVTFAVAIALAGAAMAASRPYVARKAKAIYGPTLLSTLVIDAGGPPVANGEGARIHAAELGGIETLDGPAALRRLAQAAASYERVVVSCPSRDLGRWAAALKSLGIRAELVDERVADIGALEIGSYGAVGLSTLVVDSGPLGHRARLLKRAFDLSVALVVLVPALPLMAVIALAIRLDDGGAILFRQKRIGLANEPFDILKFRTMGQSLALRRGHPKDLEPNRHITAVGAFLRRTSLDELPQLFNVLRGEMSIVGPRPHAPESLAGDKLFWEVDHRYWSRHSLKPGMTGLAQVRGLRGATDSEGELQDRLHSDLQYTANWSLARDIAILFATLRVVMHEKAY